MAPSSTAGFLQGRLMGMGTSAEFAVSADTSNLWKGLIGVFRR